jgi:3-keto-L-gulonate-6-phosphate decarboxylase
MKTVVKKEVKASFWDAEVEVGTPLVNSTGKSAIKTKMVAKDGKQFVDVRKFVNVKGVESGFGQHTTDGIAVPIEQLDAIIQALTKAREAFNKVEEAPKKKRHDHSKKAV